MEIMKLEDMKVWGEAYYSRVTKCYEYCIVAEIEIPEKISHLNLLSTDVVTVIFNPASFRKVAISRKAQYINNLLIQHKVRKNWGDEVTVMDYLDNFEELLTKLVVKRMGGEDAVFEYYEKIAKELVIEKKEKKVLFSDIEL